jgi:arabinogalactan oligomer / maltooligosaccharide transport system permease protein
MASITSQVISKKRVPRLLLVIPRLLRFTALVLVDAAVLLFLNRLLTLGYHPLALAIFIILIIVNVVLLRKEAYPLRWMIVGFIFMALFTIYPIVFTVWVSFTTTEKAT